MICLPNENVVKFSHTNRKHFTVGDPMAFPIVKIGEKTPKPLLPLAWRGPHVIQQCLEPPHAPPQTAAPTVEALLHTYAVKFPLVTMERAKFAPKSTHSRGPSSPNPTICLILGPVRAKMPYGIRIRSAIFPQCTGQNDAPTDWQIDRSRESLITIGRCTPRVI